MRKLLFIAITSALLALSACSNNDDDSGGFGSVGTVPSSSVSTIYALTNDLKIVRFAPTDPTTIISSISITGLVGAGTSDNFPLARGIAIRPKTRQLYLYTLNNSDGLYRIYTVNATTAAATLVAQLPASTNPFDGRSFAFNPVLDQIRIVSFRGGQQNFRINPDTGAVLAVETAMKYDAGDANNGKIPGIFGLAYTGGLGSTATQLYAIDVDRDNLATLGNASNSPNSGLLFTVATLSSSLGGGNNIIPFTIDPSSTAAYVSNYDASNGRSTLFRVNLTTAAITTIGQISNGALNVIGFSVDPPSTSGGTTTGSTTGGTTTGGSTTGGGVATGIITGEGNCLAALGGTGVTVTKDEGGAGCLSCSVTDENNLIDTDVTKPAVATVQLGLLSGAAVSVTVKGPRTFPAATVAGATLEIVSPIPLSAGVLPGITISTLLNSTDTGENFPVSGPLLYLTLLGQGLTIGQDRFFLGFTTTKPYDAVKIQTDAGLAGVLSEVDIYAACVNGLAGDGTPSGLIPL